MRYWWIPSSQMRWSPPRFIVGSMRKMPGLIQPREAQTLHVPTFQWKLYHLSDWFHCWHCTSRSRNYYPLLFSIGLSLEDFKQCQLWIGNTVTYRGLHNRRLAICQDRSTYPTNIHVVCSKFRLCIIIILTINLRVPVSIFGVYNSGSY